MKIGFIGQGFIGGNMADNFEDRGYHIIRYDNSNFIHNKNKIKDCEYLFIAVPTPTINNVVDISILKDVLHLTSKGQKVIIKSTIPLGTTDMLQSIYKDIFLFHSGEFLVAKTARNDVDYPDKNVVGYTDLSEKYAPDVIKLLPHSDNNFIVKAKESELGKYMNNFFLTTKVLVGNLIYDICKKNGLNYNVIKYMTLSDIRIGKTHFDVIHDGGRGANGYCFPKDLSALASIYKGINPNGDNIFKYLQEYNFDINKESGKDINNLTKILGK